MRLQSLELHGFKSFPERTKITFDAGMTVIVGPNGSGKSNIADAVKWVLGELSAKNIRGVKLEDVIFGGTDKRSPMGFAEVSLTIDNTGEFRIASDYNEITVTRRYFRTGESEYFINGQPKRLRDIVDLFMNTGIGKTGYSIIGQGRIAEIIAQRSEDRRFIFEEAAGISKFRHKKEAAERKLNDAQSNLVRATDILSTLEGRVVPLEKEAEKARIFLDIYDRKKALDIALTVYDIDNIATQNAEFTRNYNLATTALQIAQDSLQSLENQSSSIIEKEDTNRQKTVDASALLSEKKDQLHEASTQRQLKEQALEHGKTDLSRYENDIKKQMDLRAGAEERLRDAAITLTDAKGKESKFRKALDQAEAALNDLRIAAADLNTEIKQTQGDKESCEKRLIENRIRLSGLESSQSSLAERYAAAKNELESAVTTRESIEKKLERSRKALDNYAAQAEKAKERRVTLTASYDALGEKIRALVEKRNKTAVAITSKNEQALALQRLEDHLEGYQRSVRFVLDRAEKGSLKDICGPVSKLIKVDEAYSIAIETALGNNLQNIVTENEEAAKAAIRMLKKEGVGRATFYPLNSVRADKLRIDLNQAKGFDGYIGIASELIAYDRRYSEVMASLLGRTFVFDNLDNASRMAAHFNHTVRIVTLDGQLINAGGSYTGGSVKRDSGILSRVREIETLKKESEELKTELSQVEREIGEVEAEQNSVNTELEELRDRNLLLTSAIRAGESEHKILSDQLNAQLNTEETLRQSVLHIEHQEVAGKELKITLDREILELTETIGVLEAGLIRLSREAEDFDAQLATQAEERGRRQLALTVAGKDVETAEFTYNSCKDEIDRIDAECEALKNSAEQGEEYFENLAHEIESIIASERLLENEIRDIENELAELTREAEVLRNKNVDLQKMIKDKNAELRVCAEEKAKLDNKRTSLTAERDKLTERLWLDYELTYAAACELEYTPITPETRSKSVSEQNKLRHKIRELGSVNVNAIEEYAAVKEQYDTLNAQVSDLNKSMDEFSRVISDLETEMRQKFSETFVEINKNFAVTFRDLFGGGSAKLELTDPSNVLTSGIEIIVSPPGKVIKNLKALSGGEQVFVAIAILFAIFKINPPPFCLLDEIESALDEVNVTRFASYAKTFCADTQFIAISHRRGTMEAASSLYGVTMQERGVSKLLSINVEDVEKKIGIKFDNN